MVSLFRNLILNKFTISINKQKVLSKNLWPFSGQRLILYELGRMERYKSYLFYQIKASTFLLVHLRLDCVVLGNSVGFHRDS
jgi:hypothetical protein